MFELANVFVPIDNSPGSRYAYDTARFLSKLYSARCSWSHVVPKLSELHKRVVFPYAALGEDLSEFENELIQVGRELISDLVGKSADTGQVICEQPVEGILGEIRRIRPELVVIGTNGESRGQPQQLGSTVSRVLARWDGPTLLVRPFSGETPFDRILVLTDLTNGSERLLQLGVGISLRTQTPMEILTTLEDPLAANTGPLVSDAVRVHRDQFQNKGKKSARRRFEQSLSSLEIPFPDTEAFNSLKPKFSVRTGDPVSQLKLLVDQEDRLLLIVGRARASSNGSMALGRTAERIAASIPAHVLVANLG